MKFESYRFQLPDGIDQERYIRATYRIVAPKETDILDYARQLAFEQTTGTWVEVPIETEELKRKYTGKISAIYESPDYEYTVPQEVETRSYIISLEFPIENVKDQIPMLLSTIMGNIASLGEIKLLDVSFPETFLEDFQGPQFGIEGLRDLLDVPKRPLLCNMIKPDTGFPPEVGAELFYKAAKGGCDIIKDDELLGDPEYCKVEDRVTQYMEKADQAEEETGEKTLYTVNVTDRADRAIEKAEKVLDLGVNALMINTFSAGFSTARTIAEDSSIDVPLLGHIDFFGSTYESPTTGVSSPLLVGKLQRLSGVDMAIIPSTYGKFPMIRKKYMQISQNLYSGWKDIGRTLPCPAAGMHPGVVPLTIDDLGLDCCPSAGGAVHGHPQGSVAGAKALRQAIDSCVEDVPIEEYAQDHEELKAALDEWGIATEDTDMYLEDVLKVKEKFGKFEGY